ncbi:MAG: M17 family peptidase N-terminal domain-containing protein [Pseudomonadota bacterium]|nr:M17 family peptidase N-terminal domain-containing protein [Pseudomonadota bacterium]
MASKLDLTFSKTAPDGDHAVICLVGAKGELLPKLEKSLAASVIAAMATAQFTGEAGKSLTLYIGDRTVALIGIGEAVEAGAEAEAVGGRIMSAVGALQSKRGYLPEQGVTAEVLADIVMGMTSSAYHFERYFTEASSNEASVQIVVLSDEVDAAHPAIADRAALMAGVEMARDLAFEPANKLSPAEFADRC